MKFRIIEGACRRLRHRSLTCALVTVLLAFIAFGFLPEHEYRLQHGGPAFVEDEEFVAGLSFVAVIVTFWRLISDDRGGYPSFRLSVATLLWTLACVPIGFLTLNAVGDFLSHLR